MPIFLSSTLVGYKFCIILKYCPIFFLILKYTFTVSFFYHSKINFVSYKYEAQITYLVTNLVGFSLALV